jgi:glycosyltransferase involved in cell wall biosynthesis
MRIGFLLPGGFALSGPGNGVVVQAMHQAAALERRGHTVVRLNPWEPENERQLDVLQFFLGGTQLHGLTANRHLIRSSLLVFAPTIDSNQSFLAYRLAAVGGSLSARLLTVPGVLRMQAHASDVVLCRSLHERDRLVHGLGVRQDKIERVLNGCAAPDVAPGAAEEVRRALGLPAEFVLHVSAFTQERKNVLRLVEAIEPLGLPLVIAGTATPGSILTELEQRARNGAQLRLLGYVDAATKAALYSLCKVFCLPSLHEGTGLAAVEAAAYGAQIVITRNGGPRDYFLEHAHYVDPLNVAEIRGAIATAWGRAPGTALQHHVLQSLSWDASAAALERVYLRHLERRRLRHAGQVDTYDTNAART